MFIVFVLNLLIYPFYFHDESIILQIPIEERDLEVVYYLMTTKRLSNKIHIADLIVFLPLIHLLYIIYYEFNKIKYFE